jgi:hypothetical protein
MGWSVAFCTTQLSAAVIVRGSQNMMTWVLVSSDSGQMAWVEISDWGMPGRQALFEGGLRMIALYRVKGGQQLLVKLLLISWVMK